MEEARITWQFFSPTGENKRGNMKELLAAKKTVRSTKDAVKIMARHKTINKTVKISETYEWSISSSK